MSQMSELSLLIDTLISCGETLAETGRALKGYYSSPAEPAPEGIPAEKDTGEKSDEVKEGKAEKPPAEGTPRYSKEEVRGILARKANEAGGRFRTQVKALVRKYADGGSLTDVPEESYPALVKETEGLTDA